MDNMWEIGKQVRHSTGVICQVVGKNLAGRPILERVEGAGGVYSPTDLRNYEPYTPPPPNVKRYVNIYSSGAVGCDYESLEMCARLAGQLSSDRLELELTHDGKFVKARSVM